MENTAGKTLADRLEQIGSGKRATQAELTDVAGYSGEISDWANELECKFADFAANAEMLTDPDTPRDEREELREQMTADAEAAAGALRVIAAWCC